MRKLAVSTDATSTASVTATATGTAAGTTTRFKIVQIPLSAIAICFLSFALTTAVAFPLAREIGRSRSRQSSCNTNLHASYSDSLSERKNNNGKPIKQKQLARISVESYTDHWDSLLLEEHELALAEWRESRSKCSLEILEKRGLAISSAFALPDSEVLGEKTVRIHNGSGGSKSGININAVGVLDTNDKNKRSNGGGRFRRPWNEIFSKGDILMMTGNGSATLDSLIGRGGFSAQAFRRECLVMDVGDSWMQVGVGKTWPVGVWDARKGSNSKGKRSIGNSSYLGYPVRLDKTPNAAALIPLRAQRAALQTIREEQQHQQNGQSGGMMIATWLTKTTNAHCKGYYQIRNRKQWAKKSPHHFRRTNSHKNNDDDDDDERLHETYLQEAIERVTKRKSLQPSSSSKTKNWSATVNESQRDAIIWALSRRVSSIQGPPGTGKTRVAALLIATALEMAQSNSAGTSATSYGNNSIIGDAPPFRILAVAHSNGAADVLLQALLDLGVPAVRAGRPAAISASVRHRSAVALAEKMPQVMHLRKQLSETTSDSRKFNNRGNIEWELQQCIEDAHDALLNSAPVIVTSCIGAYQLSIRHDKLGGQENEQRQQKEKNQGDPGNTSDTYDINNHARFSLVVLDEAAQCTEPALMCALVAARAQQLVMVGDTKQLPPTVASSSKELRESLGISPMERLEESGLVEQKTLQIQYRMVQTLLDHPSKYFYNGMIKSAIEPSIEDKTLSIQSLTLTAFTSGKMDPSISQQRPPAGFAWPNSSLPLAFVNAGKGCSEVLHDSSLGLAGRSNPSEAKMVAQIVANILEAGELKSSQICVLTPYSKQVSVIRSTLENESVIRRRQNTILDRSNGDKTSSNVWNQTLSTLTESAATSKSINKVRVGTIDSFQGQETEVVIFSAVRSNAFSELGFLRDPRRLCVALTRARKGLVILGDSTVLNSCRHWKSLIESCQDRGCFVNKDSLSLLPSTRIAGDNGNYKDGQDENSDDATTFGDTIVSGRGERNENFDKVTERKKLSFLKPDEEFLGLFSIPSNKS